MVPRDSAARVAHKQKYLSAWPHCSTPPHDYEGEGWQSIGVTYKDWYKEDCTACTGPCRTIDALTTDEVYNVDDGEPWSDVADVALVRGTYDGETFVAA